jgi:hypothetical protein
MSIRVCLSCVKPKKFLLMFVCYIDMTYTVVNQASGLNRYITSSGRKGVERESGEGTSFQTGHIDAATVGKPTHFIILPRLPR